MPAGQAFHPLPRGAVPVPVEVPGLPQTTINTAPAQPRSADGAAGRGAALARRGEAPELRVDGRRRETPGRSVSSFELRCSAEVFPG